MHFSFLFEACLTFLSVCFITILLMEILQYEWWIKNQKINVSSFFRRLLFNKPNAMLIDIEKVSILRDHVLIIFIAVKYSIDDIAKSSFRKMTMIYTRQNWEKYQKPIQFLYFEFLILITIHNHIILNLSM